MLANKPVGKLLWQFATPSIIAMSATSIYNLCDSIFIGQGAGPLAIAGLAVTFPLMNIATAFGALVSAGGATQTSVHMGQNDRTTAQYIFGNVILLNITFSLLLMFIGITFIDPILHLFGASDATLPYARDYMQIYLLGMVFSHTFLGMTSQCRATGHPQTAMRAQLLAVVLNLILDPIFIFVFGWGIRGAALATVLAIFCSWCYIVHFFLDDQKYVHFSREILHFRASIIQKIISIGMSPFSINLCGCVVVILINRALMAQGGADGDMYIGANGITHRVTQLIILMVAGFSQGMQPIVGFNFGAKLYGRVINTVKVALIIASTILTVGYILIALFPAQLASLFTSDERMISFCVAALRISLCTFPIVGAQMIATSFFQSIRKPFLSMLISLSRQLLFLLPMLLILPPYLGTNGVWWSMPIADCFSVILSWSLLLREGKALIKLMRTAHRTEIK